MRGGIGLNLKPKEGSALKSQLNTAQIINKNLKEQGVNVKGTANNALTSSGVTLPSGQVDLETAKSALKGVTLPSGQGFSSFFTSSMPSIPW
jgi:hypothetical protein